MKTCNYAVAALSGNVIHNFGAIEQHIGFFSPDHKTERDSPHRLLVTNKLNFAIWKEKKKSSVISTDVSFLTVSGEKAKKLSQHWE